MRMLPCRDRGRGGGTTRMRTVHISVWYETEPRGRLGDPSISYPTHLYARQDQRAFERLLGQGCAEAESSPGEPTITPNRRSKSPDIGERVRHGHAVPRDADAMLAKSHPSRPYALDPMTCLYSEPGVLPPLNWV